MEDGKEVERKLFGEKIVKFLKLRIVEVGVIRWFKMLRGEVVRYRKVYIMIVIVYFLILSDIGKSLFYFDYGRIVIGYRVWCGVVVVDLWVILFGIRFYVEGYGFVIVFDIGFVIKGNRIDVFVEKDVYKFGVRCVKVYVFVN